MSHQNPSGLRAFLGASVIVPRWQQYVFHVWVTLAALNLALKVLVYLLGALT